MMTLSIATLLVAAAGPPTPVTHRPRLRELGIRTGVLAAGPLDAITDVAGVRVGHRTIVRGDSVRTGVTAVLPHAGNLFQEKVPAAVWTINGFGKAAGFLQVQELGVLEAPIVLTNTLAVGTALEAVVRWSLAQPGNETVRSVNAVVGETNDGWLSDIRSLPVSQQDVLGAIEAASPGPVEGGSVGAGTGTRALGWKGGIGTASRVLPTTLGGWTVGALVQSNFGGFLTFAGAPVWRQLGGHPFAAELAGVERTARSPAADPAAAGAADGDGSCMIVLATNAPLSPRNLERLARRSTLALGRVGSFVSDGSGDFVIAFSTARRVAYRTTRSVDSADELRNEATSPVFLAAVEAVEAAILDSLLQATTVSGQLDRKVDALPINRLLQVVEREPE